MSGPGDSYDDSSGETPGAADSDHGITQTRTVGTELADEPPAEPMSREEYADYMRQGPAADTGHDISDEDGTQLTGGLGDGYDSRWTDPAEQAQGMTREKYADFMRHGPAPGADDYDAGDDYDPAGFDQPGDTGYEPRWDDSAEQAQGMTRSEYAEYMQQGPAAGEDDALADDSLEAESGPQLKAPDQARSGTEPLIPDDGGSGADTTDLPVPTRDAVPRQAPVDQSTDENDNLYMRVGVVQAGPEDRTLGDTTPTGIGLKPTGEQLFRMEDDSGSYLEKLRRNVYERADDINDAADEYGGTLGRLFEHPPTDTHTEVPSAPKDVPSHQEHGVDGGHLATAGLVVGVLGFELFRAIRNRVETWRRR